MNDSPAGLRPPEWGAACHAGAEGVASPRPTTTTTVPPTPPPAFLTCRKCAGGVASGVAACPHCGAPLGEERPLAVRPARCRHADGTALRRAILFFVGLLAVSLVQGFLVRTLSAGRDLGRDDLLQFTLIAEGIDTLLVVAALLLVPRPTRRPTLPLRRASAWGMALPLLAGLLAFNVFYHRMMSGAVGLPQGLGDLSASAASLSLMSLLVVCVQPAIVEEVFFRHLTLGTLRSYTDTRSAVVISALMFAGAHTSVPYSIPMLAVLGVGFGCLRVWSGGLALPVLVHFLHNFAVLVLGANT